MTASLFQRLLERLAPQGVDTEEAVFFIRDLSNILESHPSIDPATATAKLNLLGWNGVNLDYQSLQLGIALIESENGSGFGERSPA